VTDPQQRVNLMNDNLPTLQTLVSEYDIIGSFYIQYIRRSDPFWRRKCHRLFSKITVASQNMANKKVVTIPLGKDALFME
jgi:hypothetical protein